jgi:outer membrane protein TolC
MSGTGGQYFPSADTGMGSFDFSSLFPDELYSANLTLTQAIYQGGQAAAALRAARLARKLAAKGVDLSRVGTTYAVKLAYAGVLLRDAFLQVATEGTDLAERHLKDVKARRAAGFITEFEELQARVQLSNAEAQRIRARTGLQTARDNLLGFLPWKLGRELALTDTLEGIAPSGEPPPLAELIALASKLRPELALAGYTEKLNAVSHSVSTAGLRPTLGLQAGYTGTGPTDPFDEDFEYDWTVGLQLRIPLFDGLAAQGKRRQALAALEQARSERASLEDDVEREVRTAYWRVQTAREFVSSQKEAVGLAEEAVRQAGARYRNGLVTEVVEQEARVGLAQARTNLAQARFELFSSSLELDRAAGLLEAPAAD